MASYSASVVNFYNATDSLACFENKKIFLYFEKRSSMPQRLRCSCEFKSRRIGSWPPCLKRTVIKSAPGVGHGLAFLDLDDAARGGLRLLDDADLHGRRGALGKEEIAAGKLICRPWHQPAFFADWRKECHNLLSSSAFSG
jgi:hypothetical protein